MKQTDALESRTVHISAVELPGPRLQHSNLTVHLICRGISRLAKDGDTFLEVLGRADCIPLGWVREKPATIRQRAESVL